MTSDEIDFRTTRVLLARPGIHEGQALRVTEMLSAVAASVLTDSYFIEGKTAGQATYPLLTLNGRDFCPLFAARKFAQAHARVLVRTWGLPRFRLRRGFVIRSIRHLGAANLLNVVRRYWRPEHLPIDVQFLAVMAVDHHTPLVVYFRDLEPEFPWMAPD